MLKIDGKGPIRPPSLFESEMFFLKLGAKMFTQHEHKHKLKVCEFLKLFLIIIVLIGINKFFVNTGYSQMTVISKTKSKRPCQKNTGILDRIFQIVTNPVHIYLL